MFVAVPPPPAGSDDATALTRRRLSLRTAAPYLYLVPALTFLVIWTYSPLVQTFALAFYDWNLLPTSERTFVGVQNFIDVVSLPEMRTAVGNTVLYVVVFMVFSLVLPIACALMSRHVSGRTRTFYQVLIFVPFLVTPVATGAVWRWLLAEQGIAATALASLSIDMPNVFRDENLALWAVIVVVGWQLLGFAVLIVAAGFANISPDYGHAAALDGAGRGYITRRITLPLLSPTIVFLGLLTILLTAQWTYPIIDLLTQGGPTDSTTNIYYLLYQLGFENFAAGQSAAAGVMFFLAFGLVAVVVLELQERLSFYDN